MRMVFAGALGLRMGSFFNSVMTNLRDWVRIYLRFVYETAEQMYSSVMKMLLVGYSSSAEFFNRPFNVIFG